MTQSNPMAIKHGQQKPADKLAQVPAKPDMPNQNSALPSKGASLPSSIKK